VLFSIIVPTYNRPASIASSIRSVASQEVSGVEIEFVIVDDSTDDTLDVARKTLAEFPRVRSILHHGGVPRLRVSGAKNKGIDLANGDICIFHDSDDELLPGALEYIRDFFLRTPKVDVLFGSVRHKSGRPAKRRVELLDRVITYEEFISRKVGEFLPIVKRSAFVDSALRFREGLDGFEAIVWYELARRGYRFHLSSTEVRLYDDVGNDRNTTAHFRLGRAAHFARGHVLMLRQFGADVRRCSATQYAIMLSKAMLYNRFASERDGPTDAFLRATNPVAYHALEGVPKVFVESVFRASARLSGVT
jgi:glycosyltransferase involved in cell wall biosynthesis